MKIYYGSDLHLEFAPANFDIPTGDILILAGDTCTPHNVFSVDNAKNTNEFFKKVSLRFKHVYLVMGNHEHYHGYLVDTREELEEWVANFQNITVLDGETVIHDDVAIFGGTLWTDFDRANPITMYDAKQYMNDFTLISYSADRININTMLPGGLSPEDIIDENKNYRELIRNFVDVNRDRKKIIVTHHAPSYISVPDRHKGDSLNGAYYNTGLDYLFENDITWIHGHVHNRYEIENWNGRILCNPRGYPNEIREDFEFKLVSI